MNSVCVASRRFELVGHLTESKTFLFLGIADIFIIYTYCVHIRVYGYIVTYTVLYRAVRKRSLKSSKLFNSSWTFVERSLISLLRKATAGKELRPIYATLPRELPNKSTEGGLGYAAARYLLAAQERSWQHDFCRTLLGHEHLGCM